MKRQKCLNLGLKIPYLHIFGIEFQKTIVIFEISTKICQFAKFHEIMKMFNFRTKNTLIGGFWPGTLKNQCHIWNQHLRVFLISKFREETKMPKCGTKNAVLRYIWARISKNYCHLLKSTTSNLSNSKFREKRKMPKFGTKNVLFEYFWGRILKNYCQIWYQHP